MKVLRIKHNSKTLLDSIIIEDEYKYNTLISELESLLKKFNMKKSSLSRKVVIFKNNRDTIEIEDVKHYIEPININNDEIKLKIVSAILKL